MGIYGDGRPAKRRVQHHICRFTPDARQRFQRSAVFRDFTAVLLQQDPAGLNDVFGLAVKQANGLDIGFHTFNAQLQHGLRRIGDRVEQGRGFVDAHVRRLCREQHRDQQFKRRVKVQLCRRMRILIAQARQDRNAFLFIHTAFSGIPSCTLRSAARRLRFSSIRYFNASIIPRPMKAPGGSMASRNGVSVWNTSIRSDFAQPPSSASAPSKSVPLPKISRREPRTNMAAVAPMPMEKPSSADMAGLFFTAKASARPTTIQLVTISGMKIPSDWYRPNA